MAKIKFPLEMANGEQVRTLGDLKDNFDIEKVVGYFLDGKLKTWLEDRYYEDESEAIDLLDKDDRDLAKKLCNIFGVYFEETKNVDAEAIAEKNARLEKLKQFTDDEEIIKNIDLVAFNQEELGDLYDKGADKIYLCDGEFNIPKSKQDLEYVEFGNAVVNGLKIKLDEDKTTSKDNFVYNDAFWKEFLNNNHISQNSAKTEDRIYYIVNMPLSNRNMYCLASRYLDGSDEKIHIPDIEVCSKSILTHLYIEVVTVSISHNNGFILIDNLWENVAILYELKTNKITFITDYGKKLDFRKNSLLYVSSRYNYPTRRAGGQSSSVSLKKYDLESGSIIELEKHIFCIGLSDSEAYWCAFNIEDCFIYYSTYIIDSDGNFTLNAKKIEKNDYTIKDLGNISPKGLVNGYCIFRKNEVYVKVRNSSNIENLYRVDK